MGKHFIFSAALMALVSVSSFAQSNSAATIGDKAPKFEHDGVVKGNLINPTTPGKVYVVEFWATWCGPCIQAMPHLSELAEKYAKQVDFVSVNSWDYAGRGTPNIESREAHVERVKSFVQKNQEKMRYNVMFDKQGDLIAKSWMDAYGRNGIPCAFIVNKEGNVAWVGHPMSMDKPLAEIVAGTWDLSAFKASFDKEAKQVRDRAEAMNKLKEAIKSKDMNTIDAALKLNSKVDSDLLMNAVLVANREKEYELATQILEKHSRNSPEILSYNWCSFASTIAQASKDEKLYARLKAISESAAKSSPDAWAAVTYCYHARFLKGIGDQAGAIEWVEKAPSMIEKFGEQDNLDRLKQFIESTSKFVRGN